MKQRKRCMEMITVRAGIQQQNEDLKLIINIVTKE